MTKLNTSRNFIVGFLPKISVEVNLKIMEIKDNTFQRQFETHLDNHLIAIEYSLQERKIFLTRVTAPESVDYSGILEEMLIHILDNAEENRQKVVPVFPKIAAFFRKNPKYKDLLPPGIKL